MWTPAHHAAERWVSIRPLREVAGRRTVVSHLAKLTRGRLVRHVLSSGAPIRTPEQLAQAAAQMFDVELTPPPRTGRPWSLDVIETGA
jgi:hypothetical protein